MRPIQINGRYFRKYPIGTPLGHADRELSLTADDTAFVLVDVYGLGFDAHPEPEAAPEPAVVPIDRDHKRRVIVERVRPALDAARAAGFPVVYVTNSAPRIALARSAYAEHKRDTLRVDKDSFYAEQDVDPREYHHGPAKTLSYSDVIAPRPGDYFIRKHVHSGFFDTRLDTLLRNLGCRNLVFVGFALDACLGTTMIDALWRNYRVLLLRDCTLASEIPTIDEPGAWTARWVLYVECAVGYTTTSADWIRACEDATP